MRIQWLDSANAFIAFDLDEAPAVGVTRLAPKVLVDGAELLARSTTYAFASFGIQMGGASAGINATPDQRDGAVAAYVAEVAPLAADGRWRTWPGTGLADADLAPLAPVHLDADLLARGAVAAAEAALGRLDGARAGVSGDHPALAAALADRGATVADDGTYDVFFPGAKSGSLDHHAAEALHARAVVPVAPVQVTAKALAVLERAGTAVVPDFLSTSATLLRAFDGDGSVVDPVERVARAVREAVGGPSLWLAAVERAEAFLLTWQASLPFGRPLA